MFSFLVSVELVFTIIVYGLRKANRGNETSHCPYYLGIAFKGGGNGVGEYYFSDKAYAYDNKDNH